MGTWPNVAWSKIALWTFRICSLRTVFILVFQHFSHRRWQNWCDFASWWSTIKAKLELVRRSVWPICTICPISWPDAWYNKFPISFVVFPHPNLCVYCGQNRFPAVGCCYYRFWLYFVFKIGLFSSYTQEVWCVSDSFRRECEPRRNSEPTSIRTLDWLTSSALTLLSCSWRDCCSFSDKKWTMFDSESCSITKKCIIPLTFALCFCMVFWGFVPKVVFLKYFLCVWVKTHLLGYFFTL